jgi:hypothetical protein
MSWISWQREDSSISAFSSRGWAEREREREKRREAYIPLPCKVTDECDCHRVLSTHPAAGTDVVARFTGVPILRTQTWLTT